MNIKKSSLLTATWCSPTVTWEEFTDTWNRVATMSLPRACTYSSGISTSNLPVLFMSVARVYMLHPTEASSSAPQISCRVRGKVHKCHQSSSQASVGQQNCKTPSLLVQGKCQVGNLHWCASKDAATTTAQANPTCSIV